MRERGNDASFALEPGKRARVVSQLFRDDLDGNLSPQTAVAGAVYLAHPSCAERRQNFVRAEPRSRNERHRRIRRGRLTYRAGSACQPLSLPYGILADKSVGRLSSTHGPRRNRVAQDAEHDGDWSQTYH